MEKTTTKSNKKAFTGILFKSSNYELVKREVKRIVVEEGTTGKGKNKKVVPVEKEYTDIVIDYVFKPVEIGVPANLKAETTDIYKETLTTLLETRVYNDLLYLSNTEEDTFKRAELKGALSAYSVQANVNKPLHECLTEGDKIVFDTIVKLILGSAKDGNKHTWANINECEKAASPLLYAVANRMEFNEQDVVNFKRCAEEFATLRLVSEFESQIFRKWDIDISTPVVNAIINNLHGKLAYRRNISGNEKVKPYLLGSQILLEVLKKTFKFDLTEKTSNKPVVED